MDLGWHEAIQKVLSQANEPLHYKAIAEEIEKLGLRESLGATPANTVNAYINGSINSGTASPYIRTVRGYYALKGASKDSVVGLIGSSEESDDTPTGLIQCLGMYWHRSNVVWKSNARILESGLTTNR